jgi:hypothetical protein
MTAEQLHAWILEAFGTREFTLSNFRATFPSPAPAKILSDLAHKGYLARERRGVYHAITPGHRVRSIVTREDDAFGLATRSPLPHAYSHETAIAIWTDGGYWTGFTSGFRPLHLDVDRRDVARWRTFFARNAARVAVEGERVTLYGLVHLLHPVEKVRSVVRGGVRVVPRRDALAYAEARPYAFEPVIPVLRRIASKASS